MHNSQPAPAVDSDALARARYFAYAQRRTMPPRCNPFGILILVLSLGMIFIGLTMTIIANWPGATSIGENPLRIAGPVLLGVGFGIFILGVIVVILLNQNEQTKWERKLTNLAADRLGGSSREILVIRQAPSASDDKPYKLNLRSGEASVSTEGKSACQKDDPSTSRSSGTYVMKGRYSSSTMEMLPDPTKKPNISAKLHDVSLDSENKVPDPMRIQKRRNTSRKSDSSFGSVNHSYSSEAGEADLGVPGMLMPSRLSQPSTRIIAYSNAVYEHDLQKKGPGINDPGTCHGGDKTLTEFGGQRSAGTSEPIHEAIARGAAQFYSTDQQQLRVHIKAQPGTAIHITPSGTPPHSRLPYQFQGKPSLDTSGETEI